MERFPRWAAVAVIAAVVLGVVVGVLATRDSGDSGKPKSLGPVSTHVVDGGDLRDLNDDAALRAKVEPVLATSASAPRSTQSATTCEGETRALQPGTEVLVYRATATWQGTPAVVLGFSPVGAPATNSPGRRPPTRVYVVARSGCRLLSFQSYAP
jgi:hypothetical protein